MSDEPKIENYSLPELTEDPADVNSEEASEPADGVEVDSDDSEKSKVIKESGLGHTLRIVGSMLLGAFLCFMVIWYINALKDYHVTKLPTQNDVYSYLEPYCTEVEGIRLKQAIDNNWYSIALPDHGSVYNTNQYIHNWVITIDYNGQAWIKAEFVRDRSKWKVSTKYWTDIVSQSMSLPID